MLAIAKTQKMSATWRRRQNPVMFRLLGTSTRILVMPEESHAGIDSSNITTILIEVPMSLNMTRFCRHRHIGSIFVFLRWCFVCVNTISCRWNLWNENSSLQNMFINWWLMIMLDKVYIRNQMAWGESKIAERQRKREGERQSITVNERWRGQ